MFFGEFSPQVFFSLLTDIAAEELCHTFYQWIDVSFFHVIIITRIVLFIRNQ